MKTFARTRRSVETTPAGAGGTPQAPQGGPELRQALARYQATRERFLATRTDAQGRRAAGPHMTARRRLYEMILRANGHDPNAPTIPACGVSLGGKVVRLDSPPEGWNLLNAEMSVN
jgi:hypothetical protein